MRRLKLIVSLLIIEFSSLGIENAYSQVGLARLNRLGVQAHAARFGKVWQAARRAPVPLPIGMSEDQFEGLVKVIMENKAFDEFDGVALYGSRTRHRAGWLPETTSEHVSDLDISVYRAKAFNPNLPRNQQRIADSWDEMAAINEALRPVQDAVGFKVSQEIPRTGMGFSDAIKRQNLTGIGAMGYPNNPMGLKHEVDDLRDFEKFARANPQLSRDEMKAVAFKAMGGGANPGRQAIVVVRGGDIGSYVKALKRAGIPKIIVPR